MKVDHSWEGTKFPSARFNQAALNSILWASLLSLSLWSWAVVSAIWRYLTAHVSDQSASQPENQMILSEDTGQSLT